MDTPGAPATSWQLGDLGFRKNTPAAHHLVYPPPKGQQVIGLVAEKAGSGNIPFTRLDGPDVVKRVAIDEPMRSRHLAGQSVLPTTVSLSLFGMK